MIYDIKHDNEVENNPSVLKYVGWISPSKPNWLVAAHMWLADGDSMMSQVDRKCRKSEHFYYTSLMDIMY